MKKYSTQIIYFIFALFIASNANSKTNFFEEAKKLYISKKYDKSKFLLEKNIVYNPKHYKSYLYLAKIYREKKNDEEEKKNLDTTLLIDSKNEEALYMLIEFNLKKSNFSKVNKLMERFSLICLTLCDSKKKIQEKLKAFEQSNESEK